MREVVDAPPAAPLLLPSLSTTSETPPTVSLCLRAPLVLHNLLCVPMLYRVVNRQVRATICVEANTFFVPPLEGPRRGGEENRGC